MDWPNLQKYAVANKSVPIKEDEARIVFMGDSITEFWKEKNPKLFTARNYINRGISGQTTSQMLLRFRQDVIDLKPFAVLILAGINDIAENTGPISLENVFGNIISMAELAQSNQIKVVLCSVLPAKAFPWRPDLKPADKIVRLNEMILEFAFKNDLIYVNYYSEMVSDDKGLQTKYSSDGVHPNALGYKTMQPFLEEAIAKVSRKDHNL